ncbi:MAG: hypothetical protein ACE5I7_00275 [Candidatus Binatia bacterium]
MQRRRLLDRLWLPFLTGLLWASSVAAASPPRKTLTRFHDPVIVSTSLLAGLADHRTAQSRLYSARRGVLVPIPFQFDARHGDGDVVFPDTAADQEFVFDDNDELVFMAKDTGDRVPRSVLPSQSDAALEIAVTDPLTGEQGWTYLLHFPGAPPPRSPVTYATFDVQTNQARTPLYTMEYYPGRNFFTGMRIAPAAGGTGENILDRMKVRVNPTFSLLLTSWSPLFTEEDFSVKIDGVKNGAVRAIRRVRQWLNLGKFFPHVPGGTVYTYYYFSSFSTPSKFSIPWLVLKALRGFRFVGANDFRNSAIGMTYWDAANPQGLPYTGHNHATVNRSQDHGWWVVSGRGGTCLHAFVIPEQWRKWGIARGTIFTDDSGMTDAEGPEDNPGSFLAGYSLLHMTNLRQPGVYDMNLAVFILPHPYRPGDEAQPLAMLKHPLRAKVHPVE